METLIAYTLGHFPLVLVVLSVLFAIFCRKEASFGEALSRYLLLLPIGLGGIWGFYFHAFFPDYSAEMIGWEPSPFQYEIAVANLGMGVAGVIGFWRKREFAVAVALMVSGFLWGAAVFHIRDIILHSNYAPGNAGSILYTDIAIPLLLWIGILLWRPKTHT